MKTTLIITTYNWKEALKSVLDSVLRQTELPDEVVIADDGSRQDTIDMVAEYQFLFPVPLIHSWHEDNGFQLSMSRNKAIAKASGDYLIMIDGDIVLPPSFVQSHKQSAKKGWFVQGGRVLTEEGFSKKIMHENAVPTIFSSGIRNRKNCITSPFLSRIFSYERNNDKATRGCNMAFWRDDVIEVNGFNQEFVGWGREDSEFVLRMLNSKKRRLYLKFAGVGYHLYHKENSRASLSENDAILERTIKEKLTRCDQGIDQYLKAIHD
ncbi:glycosyltransferase family 2 protein [Aliivibrio sp. S4TY2]|uniref:glycosyltransferase family 2 protein n=1 Tax=unclassified Aliivibrio TaxID=2645654 RepID=UPI0023798FC5|nr:MULTISPECIES: glycosyltransferase family 2 protein [unclassified Aliivibrio]MDD9156001.1 glycosyltransferase family 2 protein [Aliivibrio sp. S4TY2]MDD9159710.1 glycosyltransferase family 2 protein [Aliivibrio sp. S4TY1]MDD9167710.1 glycosyltransferase family 2 protein [Aliivibrio sp. S4MY4]MDD9185626.1 glycosyltransferase family 2 protein [Aliivibrio sp. S4MY3]MDD9202146.1 glycosyltransferase family 2 protein [Aliivibrio sp. S4MY1]